VSFQDQEYSQIAYDVANTNLSTPFNLSTLHFTKNGVSEDFVGNRFHLHHLGKNVVNGKLYDIEMHIIHGGSKSNLVLSTFFEAVPGDFPDPFDHWTLDSPVAVQQKFPIKLATPEDALYYDSIPNCSFSFGVAFLFNLKPIKIKQSTLERIGKLIDATKPPKADEGNFFVQPDVCRMLKEDAKKVGKKDGKAASIHHKLRLAD
jgi:carbonic anhydrase